MCHCVARRSWAWLVWGLACIALSCGEARSLSRVADDTGSFAGASEDVGSTAAGGPSNSRLDGVGQGENGVGSPPASVAACPTDAPFIWVAVHGQPNVDGPQRVRFIDRGLGLPPEVTDLPLNASSPTRVGWLRVAVVQDAADAGADTEPSDELTGDEPIRTIVGPREMIEVAVSIGEQLELIDEWERNSSYNMRRRVMLRRGELILFLHLYDQLGGSSTGFTFEHGRALCATPVVDPENPCADIYQNELEVTVPGGASARLSPGQAQTVGDYRVYHGTSTTTQRVFSRDPANSSCADLPRWTIEIMAVLQSGAL